MEERGGAAAFTDCVAYPGQKGSGIWLVVRCKPPSGDGVSTYHVNRLGGLEFEGTGPVAAPQEPQT